MRGDAYTDMHAVEGEHWWFVARRKILDKIIRRFARRGPLHLLEAGCGTGGNLRMLANIGRVTAFEPNAAGLHDMMGNLWEWIADCYHDSYRGQPSPTRNTGAAWTEGCNRDLRVLRGGSWSDQPDSLRPATRIAIPGDKRIQIGGFRVARSLEPWRYG